MIKKIMYLCQQMNINIKKQWIILLVGNGVLLFMGLCLFTFFRSFLSLLALPLMLLYTLSNLYSLEYRYKIFTLEKEMSFLRFYPIVLSFLCKGYVLTDALNKSSEYCEKILKEDIDQWMDNLDVDFSLLPFLHFSESFKNDDIKQMILLLFQVNDENFLIDTLMDETSHLLDVQQKLIDIRVEQEKKAMDKYKFVPILLTVTMLLFVCLNVLKQMGGMNNV